ncbi:gpi mannosyltransferase 2 [Echinococcus multilocularis]|uniref:GPI mannosyltransferase 2 n=1 Tax=Echinococcus multilocularis TaxID=6211 RepID=A0A068YCM7_ECHMU|nr:gpi mannosyltransferase 2 [Echinococcus multilocularis]
MKSECKNLIAFAAIVKLLVIILLILSSLLPNHKADAFEPPEVSCTSNIDCLLRYILDGFHKWDAIYFHFISVNGYLLENTLAFFPLFPIFLRLISSLTYTLLPLWSFWTHSILVGVVLSFFCNLLCTIQMYRLSKLLLMSDSLSVVSALLFAINPASVFFTTLYSEALYSFLFLSALIWIYECKYVTGCLILSMTVLCRSNGLVNCGFPCFFQFILLVNKLRSLYGKGRHGSAKHSPLPISAAIMAVFHRFLALLAVFLCMGSPYLTYQYYAGFLYCSTLPKPASLSFMLPKKPGPELEEFANELGVLTPYSINSSFQPVWCAGVPWSSYMLLQKKFWDVGAFNYYRWRQLPNFLLALPVLFLIFKVVSLFGRKTPKTIFSFGLLEDSREHQLLVPHIYHALFLSIYGIINVHIQVLTRMLFSSCPVLYWYCASVLLNEQDNIFGRSHLRKAKTMVSSMPRQLIGLFRLVNPLSYPPWSSQRTLLYYFYSYIVIGCLMHSNFLPWT